MKTHIGVDLRYLLESGKYSLVTKPDGTFMTKDDILDMIQTGKSTLVFGDCDNQDETGMCKGHDS